MTDLDEYAIKEQSVIELLLGGNVTLEDIALLS